MCKSLPPPSLSLFPSSLLCSNNKCPTNSSSNNNSLVNKLECPVARLFKLTNSNNNSNSSSNSKVAWACPDNSPVVEWAGQWAELQVRP